MLDFFTPRCRQAVIFSIIIGVRDKKDILNIILVNVLTNPLVTSIPILVLVTIGWKERIIMLIILELLTFITEGFIYYKTLKFKKINPLTQNEIFTFSKS